MSLFGTFSTNKYAIEGKSGKVYSKFVPELFCLVYQARFKKTSTTMRDILSDYSENALKDVLKYSSNEQFRKEALYGLKIICGNRLERESFIVRELVGAYIIASNAFDFIRYSTQYIRENGWKR